MTNTQSTETAKADVAAAPVAAPDRERKVELTLSTFLPARTAVRLGLPNKELKPGEKINVRSDEAASLIEQGAGGVDPKDTDAVNKILGIK